jgi:hypothetical protein
MRKVLALFAAFAMLFTLAACGGDDDSSSSSSTTGGDSSSAQATKNHDDIVNGFVSQGATTAAAECMWDKVIAEFPELESAPDGTPPPDGFADKVRGFAEDCKNSTGDGTGGSGTDTGS